MSRFATVPSEFNVRMPVAWSMLVSEEADHFYELFSDFCLFEKFVETHENVLLFDTFVNFRTHQM